MAVTVRSFSKINLGLCIGGLRPDGFHDLRTIYQTLALHDIIRLQIGRGAGIEIRCEDARVPKDVSNTCYRIVERAMEALGTRGRVAITIEKRLPVQGGLGAGSANAVATLIALELVLKKKLPGSERLRIAAEVGSDLPLFLVGGTVLGMGRGEEVYPLPDLPATVCVVATPEVGVSTPKAFADWDEMMSEAVDTTAQPGSPGAAEVRRPHLDRADMISKLTPLAPSDRINKFSRRLAAWLSSDSQRALSGVPANSGRGRAETSLLDLVRTGIENDFEQVVFSENPELREIKGVLERAGASYAALSGSGSVIYGLFASREAGLNAIARLRHDGIPAVVTSTLTRQQYWKKFLVSGF